MQYILFALAAIAPALASPLVARETEPIAKCQSFVDAHTPNHKDYFAIVCNDCYDAAESACSTGKGKIAAAAIGGKITCVEDQIEDWTFTAQVNATSECSSATSAKEAYVCIDGKIEDWVKAGNCKI